jgi:uncharacterized YigZ family protein
MEGVFKFKTIAYNGTGDFRDRGSKFLAYAYPVDTSAQIKGYIQSLKKEHPKAAHHCVGWRLGIDGAQYRAADDGEPAGSAGKPILGQIDSMGLTNCLVVVVRYFGGTLLGVPGLINAYKTATALALEPLTTIERWVESVYEVTFDYPVMGEILYLLKQSEATIHRQELQLFCTVIAGIPNIYVQQCVAKLIEVRGVQVKPTDLL